MKTLFDTSAFIAYRRIIREKQLETDYLSAVVLGELVAGAFREDRVNQLRAIQQKYQRRQRYVVPHGEDWWEAGKIMNRLAQLHFQQTGAYPKWATDRKYNLIRDVLIARSAKAHGATVISDNVDFPEIQRVYKFKWIRASEFFGQ
jgi:predicted nucleic acid-binding protein